MATQVEKDIEKKIRKAQTAWANGVVRIGRAKDDREEYTRLANQVLDDLYDFDEEGNFILFKPTLASEVPVRINREQTASYFIGGSIVEDTNGFALTPWKDVSFAEEFFFAVLDSGDVLVMGRCTFYPYPDSTCQITTADYTFGYRKGSMRIFLHHSSKKMEPKEQTKCQKEQYA
ncbi:MAG: phosphoribosyl-AMP cyclohydrolase [Roseivirga sp.]